METERAEVVSVNGNYTFSVAAVTKRHRSPAVGDNGIYWAVLPTGPLEERRTRPPLLRIPPLRIESGWEDDEGTN